MRLILATVLATTHAEWDSGNKCWRGPTSRYDGDISKTKSGKTCQKWNLEVPHKPKHRPKEVSNGGKIHNYCRNPDLDLAGPWCYTTDEATRWEYCNITACSDDDSYIIWTNFDAEHQSSHLVRVHANPEVVRDQTDQSGSFNVHAITMTHTNESLTEYWALAGDYQNTQIYWTDYRAEHIGRYDWTQNKTYNNLYKGMAHGIENLAVDWLTGNLYWTDSDYKWIMVANKDFSQYTQVYKATDDPDGPPYGLAIHSTQRKLFWSTYKIMGATIKRADLTANGNDPTNHKTIVKFPVVHDVTGLTVDYVDDRIYWTDFLGSAAVVSSSDFDGNHIINHFHRTGSVFWGVACYDHYLYVSDIYPKFMQDGKKYMLWVVTKLYINETYDLTNTTEDYVPQDQLSHPANEQKSFRYSITGRPRGVSVYSKYAAPADNVPNPCGRDANGMYGGCDHICIPKDTTGTARQRVCKCGIGYSLSKPQQQGCYANIQKPPYLVFADVDHGLIFQMSLDNENADQDTLKKREYNVIPSKNADSIHALCIDPLKLKIYYADKISKRILARKIHVADDPLTHDEEQEETIHTGVIAQSCVVDNEGSNIFFVEGETRNIQVISTQGSDEGNAYTVFKSDSIGESDQTPNIQNIAIDSRSRRLYWTDPTLTEGQGKISSSNFDGSDYKVVIKELNWPQGIKIYNHNDNVLFFTEALTGVIYELTLSFLATIGADGIKGEALQAKTAGITSYNITEANPRLKQFHMDIALHGDYLYFTDLKNNAIERFNRKAAKADKSNLKVETYGPAEFYSLIYMYAVTNETTDQSDYSKTDCYKCWNVNKLCLPKIDADKKTEPLCKCGDGYEQDFDGNCMEVEEETEYIVENCPKDAQQSSSMCENNLHYELFEPKMSRNGNKLDTNQFSIKRNYFNVGQGDDGKPSTSTKEVGADTTSIQLPSGTNIIRYEVTDIEYKTKVTCQWTVQAIVHQCNTLKVEETVGPNFKIATCDCNAESQACATGSKQPLGMKLDIQCKDANKRIQPMIGKDKIQDRFKTLDVSTWTIEDASCDSMDGCDSMVKLFPSKSIYYRCEAVSEEFQIVNLNKMDNHEEVRFECVDFEDSGPVAIPTAKAATPDNSDNSESSAKTTPTEPQDDSIDYSNKQSKGKGGIAAVVIIVLIIVAIIAIVMYKKMRTDYDGGFSFKGIFSRAPDPTAEMEVPNTSTPYSAM